MRQQLGLVAVFARVAGKNEAHVQESRLVGWQPAVGRFRRVRNSGAGGWGGCVGIGGSAQAPECESIAALPLLDRLNASVDRPNAGKLPPHLVPHLP